MCLFAQFLRDSALYRARGEGMEPHDDAEKLREVIKKNGNFTFCLLTRLDEN